MKKVKMNERAKIYETSEYNLKSQIVVLGNNQKSNCDVQDNKNFKNEQNKDEDRSEYHMERRIQRGKGMEYPI